MQTEITRPEQQSTMDGETERKKECNIERKKDQFGKMSQQQEVIQVLFSICQIWEMNRQKSASLISHPGSYKSGPHLPLACPGECVCVRVCVCVCVQLQEAVGSASEMEKVFLEDKKMPE